MANIELVIKIPEEEYKNYLKMRPSYPEDMFCYIKAIQNGTPLPKGHGRLSDIDELHSIFERLCDAYHIDNLSFMSDMDMNFDLAPTTIEADTESEV